MCEGRYHGCGTVAAERRIRRDIAAGRLAPDLAPHLTATAVQDTLFDTAPDEPDMPRPDARPAIRALFDRPDRTEWTDADAAERLERALLAVLDHVDARGDGRQVHAKAIAALQPDSKAPDHDEP